MDDLDAITNAIQYARKSERTRTLEHVWGIVFEKFCPKCMYRNNELCCNQNEPKYELATLANCPIMAEVIKELEE